VEAGTGAIAALISEGAVESQSGGHGWLVGDEGSAVWLGRKGTQAALQTLDGRGPDTMLATAIPDALDIEVTGSTSITPQIVKAIYGRPPARIGELAPVVIDASELGDRVAQELVEAAADHLARTGAAAMGDEQPAVVVLAGSLLSHATPLKRLVRAKLTDQWPAALVVQARSGEAGAVAIAIARYGGTAVTDAMLADLRSDRAPQLED
jgi:N-acetylglucosamine kinase-like BadF-type ATPase